MPMIDDWTRCRQEICQMIHFLAKLETLLIEM
jgi:hypothetical protein